MWRHHHHHRHLHHHYDRHNHHIVITNTTTSTVTITNHIYFGILGVLEAEVGNLEAEQRPGKIR